jgi:hypothetical protein
LGREIYDLFVAPGARLRLRLTDTIRRPLSSMFGRVIQLSPAAVPSPPSDLYHAMEDYLKGFIQAGQMARFMASEAFPLVSLVLLSDNPFVIHCNTSSLPPEPPPGAVAAAAAAAAAGIAAAVLIPVIPLTQQTSPRGSGVGGLHMQPQSIGGAMMMGTHLVSGMGIAGNNNNGGTWALTSVKASSSSSSSSSSGSDNPQILPNQLGRHHPQQLGGVLTRAASGQAPHFLVPIPSSGGDAGAHIRSHSLAMMGVGTAGAIPIIGDTVGGSGGHRVDASGLLSASSSNLTATTTATTTAANALSSAGSNGSKMSSRAKAGHQNMLASAATALMIAQARAATAEYFAAHSHREHDDNNTNINNNNNDNIVNNTMAMSMVPSSHVMRASTSLSSPQMAEGAAVATTTTAAAATATNTSSSMPIGSPPSLSHTISAVHYSQGVNDFPRSPQTINLTLHSSSPGNPLRGDTTNTPSVPTRFMSTTTSSGDSAHQRDVAALLLAASSAEPHQMLTPPSRQRSTIGSTMSPDHHTSPDHTHDGSSQGHTTRSGNNTTSNLKTHPSGSQ